MLKTTGEQENEANHGKPANNKIAIDRLLHRETKS